MFKTLTKDPLEAKPKTAEKPNSCCATKKTKLIVHCDCGFNNHLTIRGQGAFGLNWTKGIPLKNISSNEWAFETDLPFTESEYKILINDMIYENGPNHILKQGTTTQHTPHF